MEQLKISAPGMPLDRFVIVLMLIVALVGLGGLAINRLGDHLMNVPTATGTAAPAVVIAPTVITIYPDRVVVSFPQQR